MTRALVIAVTAGIACLNTAWGATGTCNVRQHGAAGDGATLDTKAINAAIGECAAAGGGQVLVPPGKYLSGTIRLKSNITLMIEAGAEIIGTPDLTQYEGFTPPKGNPLAAIPAPWHRALVLGVDVENVTIAGRGVINGNKVFDPQGEERMRGPHAMLFGNSRNIALHDIWIRDAGNYGVMLEFTSDVNVRGVKVTGGWDGIHFRGWIDQPCRNVTISDSEFYTGDDAIAGWHWEDTLITRCTFNSSCNGIRVIGPVKRLTIHDSLFFGPGRFEHRTSRERHRTNMLAGILIQPGAWGPTPGRVEDVRISNITMHDVAAPFGISLTPGSTAGHISIDRLTATSVYQAAASIESWAEDAIDRVTLRDVNLEFKGGGTEVQARLAIQRPRTDARVLPTWGLYARKIKNLDLQNVRLNLLQPDVRPAFRAEDVQSIELDSFKLPATGTPPFALSDVRELRLRDTDLKVVSAKCISLAATAAPLTANAVIENGTQEGLARVQMSLDGQTQTRWVGVLAAERREVVFGGWATPAAGSHTLQCGEVKKQITLP